MIFCEQCGNKLNDGAKFCGKCGAAIAAGQAEATQASTPGASNEESPAKKAFNAGMACIEAERFDEAIAHFSEAIRLRPDAADPYAKRGYAYEQKEDHDLAIADYTKALQIAPNSDAAYCLRGLAYYNKDQYDNAFADFNKAISLDPNEASYYGYRGIMYLEVGDVANANADLQRGIQLDPDDETVQQLAEALKEEGGQGGMSAPGACSQCGAPLEEDEMFCANCGAKVGAVAQRQSAPAQAQRQGGGEQILKEGWFSIETPIVGIGRLSLYRDRLEWESDLSIVPISKRDKMLKKNPEWVKEKNVVISLDEIASIKDLASYGIEIKMSNKTKYGFVGLGFGGTLAFDKSWIIDIESLCPHLG